MLLLLRRNLLPRGPANQSDTKVVSQMKESLLEQTQEKPCSSQRPSIDWHRLRPGLLFDQKRLCSVNVDSMSESARNLKETVVLRLMLLDFAGKIT